MRGLAYLDPPRAFPSVEEPGRNSPPSRRSPSTSPSQRARRPGRSAPTTGHRIGVEAIFHPHDALAIHRSQTAQDAAPPRALPVIWSSFVRAFPGLPRCAGHPAAAPTGRGTGPAIHRPRRAARGGDCRSAAAPPGELRPAGLPQHPEVSRHAGASNGQQRRQLTRRRRPEAKASSMVRRLSSASARSAASTARTYRPGYVTVKVRKSDLVSPALPSRWSRNK